MIILLIYYEFQLGCTIKEAVGNIIKWKSFHAVKQRNAYYWFSKFRNGDLNLEDRYTHISYKNIWKIYKKIYENVLYEIFLYEMSGYRKINLVLEDFSNLIQRLLKMYQNKIHSYLYITYQLNLVHSNPIYNADHLLWVIRNIFMK